LFTSAGHHTNSTQPSAQRESGESSDLTRNSIPPRLATPCR
jgi:hypothetical protein